MRVLVCGGRDYADRDALFSTLAAMHAATPFAVVIHGAAKGADARAGEWAESVGVPVEAYPADWRRFQGAAGPKRNARMLAEGKPDDVGRLPRRNRDGEHDRAGDGRRRAGGDGAPGEGTP